MQTKLVVFEISGGCHGLPLSLASSAHVYTENLTMDTIEIVFVAVAASQGFIRYRGIEFVFVSSDFLFFFRLVTKASLIIVFLCYWCNSSYFLPSICRCSAADMFKECLDKSLEHMFFSTRWQFIILDIHVSSHCSLHAFFFPFLW